MKNLIIYGNSDFSRLLKWYIENDDSRKVVAFCTEKEYLNGDYLEDLPVIDFDMIELLYPPEEFDILLGVGYKKMNDIRKRIYYSCKQKGYKIASYFHSSTLINSEDIGEGNIILEQSLISPFVTIGNCNLIWNNVSIAHDDKIGDFNTISGMAGIAGKVTIKNNCFLGKGCIVSDHLTINDYALIGAGAFVGQNIPQYSVVAATKGVILVGKKSTDFL